MLSIKIWILFDEKYPTDDAGKEYLEANILAMNLIVYGLKQNLIPYISNIDSAHKMYEALSTLFTIKNIGHIINLKNEIIIIIKMMKYDIASSYFVRISRIRDELQDIDEVVI